MKKIKKFNLKKLKFTLNLLSKLTLIKQFKNVVILQVSKQDDAGDATQIWMPKE